MKRFFFTVLFIGFAISAGVIGVPAQGAAQDDFVGEFSSFGVKVPRGNYNFIRAAIQLFGNRWAEPAQDDEALDNQVWDQLLLSYEAFRRDIVVDDPQLKDELSKMLKGEKVEFDWEKEPEKFENWAKERTGVSTEFLKNQMKHMIQLENLRKAVMETFNPSVSEDEALKEFINEYNTIDLELVQFDKKEDAEAYYRKMKDYRSWDKEGKKDPKFARRPGFVSFEFLINMWKIPKEDLYKMIEMDVNTVYPPRPVWKGYAVFRILKKRAADPNEFPKVKESYLKQVEMLKKYDSLKLWLEQLREAAGIVKYPRSETERKNTAPDQKLDKKP